MSRKLKISLILIPSVTLFILAAIYLSLSFYYRNGFSYGTWINGVYCTGKGIEEINSELKTKYETSDLVIKYNAAEYYINPEDIDFTIDFSSYLEDILSKQNSFLWFKNLFGKSVTASITPDFTFDSDKLAERINNLEFVKEYSYPEGHYVEIKMCDTGYELVDTNGRRISTEILSENIINALYTGNTVDVDDSYFYTENYTKQEEEIIENWKLVQPFFETKIILDMGAEQIPVDKKVLSRFVSLSDKGMFVLNNETPELIKDNVKEYVDELLDEYDTYKDSRDFITTDGELKTIDLVLYGTLVNHDDLTDYLYEAVSEEKKETYTPVYIRKGYVRGKNDIGNTYVEIDMGKQILYYYKDGQLLLKTDIVTGKPSTPTPAMVTCVNSKSRNVTLRGTNYASFVKYWVPIYPKMGIGLHDASWQRSFGGDLYLTRGSHGCVNMITDDIAFLYDELEIGMPVICYY